MRQIVSALILLVLMASKCEKQTIEGCLDFELIKTEEMQNMPQNGFVLNFYTLEGKKLTLNISFSGCGDNQDQKLIVSKEMIKTLPPKRDAILSFPEQMCEAYITTDICYDLSVLKEKTVLLLQTEKGIEEVILKP